MKSKGSFIGYGIAYIFAAIFGAYTAITFQLQPQLGVVLAVVILVFYQWQRSLNKRNFRHGEEYGSARWGTKRDIDPFVDPKFKNNIILSATEFLTMNSRMDNPLYNRNKNVEVVGGSGSGKTRFVVKPNMMQMHSSYVITDPKGNLIRECGQMYEQAGYKIKVLNTIDFKQSCHYNPFAYIKEEKDILTFVNVLMTNLRGSTAGKTQDPFWDKAVELWLQAIIAYIWYEAPDDEKNMGTVVELLNASEVREDDESYKNGATLIAV